jgi:hypothetical protein
MKNKNKSVLVISDCHIPYSHQDLIPFLKAIKAKYKPDRVICIGDEVDHHAMSFHDSDPDLMSAGPELERSIQMLKPIYKLFPKVDLVDSNHGSMAYRKGKHGGIPRKYLRGYNEVLDAPKGWVWHNSIKLKLSDGSTCFFTHGLSANGIKLAQMNGMSVVQGHYHSVFNVTYHSSPEKLIWSMQVGCLIDDKALAFEYNKVTASRPIIGLGMIIDGQPKLIPMLLNKNGRWNGRV